MKKDIEPYYQKQAKDFVDMLNDNKIVNPDLSRNDLRTVEDYVAYLLQSQANMASKTAVMLERLKR
jgi:ATP-dependent Clp protease adapter protein ClpS